MPTPVERNATTGERFKRCTCGGIALWQDYCAAYVCDCGAHVDLARCYCGWSQSGGDGRRELIEMGERLGDDL